MEDNSVGRIYAMRHFQMGGLFAASVCRCRMHSERLHERDARSANPGAAFGTGANTDASFATETREMMGRLLARTKAQYDQYTSGKRLRPPQIDMLIISGGGDWGSFGAGFLKGWERISADDPMAMPQFTAVTGVSTGTLIAPFAFLGDPQSIETIDHLYRNPQPDWVKRAAGFTSCPTTPHSTKSPDSNVSFVSM